MPAAAQPTVPRLVMIKMEWQGVHLDWFHYH